MPSKLVLPAPAKLNLFLHITGRRPDGYHSLQTLFQFLEYGDELSFTKQDNLELVCDDIPALATSENLIMKAVQLLWECCGTRHGAKITLTKRLPLGGGVGGGSSDAATTLLGLNMLWNLSLQDDELAELGLKLGADVPVFVRGHAAFAEGVGEILTPMQPPENWYLVLKPDCHVNTTEMFKHKELTRDTPAIKSCVVLDWLRDRRCRNDFEPLVRRLYPEIEACFKLLDNAKGLGMGQPMMSGSGACVFAPFASHEQAEAARAAINFSDCFVAHGVNKSPLHKMIARLQT